MMVKLIAIDMDGTLLNSEKKIPQTNIDAIQEAAQAGIKIVICTGRPRSGILPYFEQLGLTDEEYIIMNNGCSVYNTKTWDLVHSAQLTFDEVGQLADAVSDYPQVCLTLTTENTYYALADAVPELVQYDAGLVFDTAKATSLEALKDDTDIIFQAMYMAEPDQLDLFQADMAEEVSQSFSTVRSQSYLFEVMPQGTTKASALKQLAQHLGFAPDQVMALGDAANDLEMLEFAGVSVAMGNATDEVKTICKHVTASNDEAGVAQAILDIALN